MRTRQTLKFLPDLPEEYGRIQPNRSHRGTHVAFLVVILYSQHEAGAVASGLPAWV